MVILDTDHLSLLEHVPSQTSRRLRDRLATLGADEVATTIITYEEQTRGWLAYAAKARTIAQQVAAYERLERHLTTYRIIPIVGFSARAAVQYQRLLAARVRVGAMDLRIAAIALSLDALLLSRNLTDFRKIPNLRVEDWSS
jgi:tRNA(fMet)-specific endonuclease VapC